MKITKSTIQITFEREALIDFFVAVNRCFEADKQFDFLSAFEQHELVKFLDATADTCGYKGVTRNGNKTEEKQSN